MIDDKNAFDMDFAVLEDRANQVRENTDFQTLVSQAMADKINNWNNEYDHIEQMIYAGGFPSKEDKDLMADFHRIDSAEERIKICRNITMSAIDYLQKDYLPVLSSGSSRGYDEPLSITYYSTSE